jgi:hypothetical protein
MRARAIARWRLAVLLLVTGLSLPSRARAADEERSRLKVPSIARDPSWGPYGNPHEQRAEIARRVPGFAGVYDDHDHALVIRLVDPSRADAARIEAARVLRRDTSRARIERAKYDFLELLSWKWGVMNRCMALIGGIGIDEPGNAVRVSVAKEADVGPFRACADEVGVSRDALLWGVGESRLNSP